jgi:hypothetical protein
MITSQHEADIARMFERETADNTLTIQHDDKLYRHLVMRTPGLGLYWSEVTTWPSRLAVAGDLGRAFVFCGTRDMFELFRGSRSYGSINPGYWATKLDGEDGARDYSERKFRASITQALDDQAEAEFLERTHALAETLAVGGVAPPLGEAQAAKCLADTARYMAGLRAAVEADIFGDDSEYNIEYESEAARALAEFEYREPGAPHDQEPFTFAYCDFDRHEWHDWSADYLRACHAIVATIAAYDERTRPVEQVAVTGGVL